MHFNSLIFQINITATIKPYIPNIPAIITGITLFIINSGFNTPIEHIPTW